MNQPVPDAKPLLECERLVLIAQNRGGLRLDQETREEALIKLIHDFQYMILKIARDTWDRKSNESFADFKHDAVTTFLELIIDDYLPVAYGGASPFAPYVQTKLYWRMKDKTQRAMRHYDRQSSPSAPRFESESCDYRNSRVAEVTFQTITDASDAVMEDFRHDQICATLDELMQIAGEVLDPRQLEVFNKHFLTKTMIREIGEGLNPPVGTARVHQLISQARGLVMKEFGQRQVRKALRQ